MHICGRADVAGGSVVLSCSMLDVFAVCMHACLFALLGVGQSCLCLPLLTVLHFFQWSTALAKSCPVSAAPRTGVVYCCMVCKSWDC
jgi:hypothetical protein